MSVIEIKHPELLTVIDENGKLHSGGDQLWFPREGFIPKGACGATTASNILAYMLRTRPELYAFAQESGLDGIEPPVMHTSDQKENTETTVHESNPVNKNSYIEFMKKVYRFLYPRVGGLMANHFMEGMTELAESYSLPVVAESMSVPIALTRRPAFADVAGFVNSSLCADIPVAFLILSGGGVEHLDTWHWVTITALDEGSKQGRILDNTRPFWANIGVWLETSIMGGSFIRLQVLQEA